MKQIYSWISKSTLILLMCTSFLIGDKANAQEASIAKVWNETLLDCIRLDKPSPVGHSRNLFHTSAAMYDAWAAYDEDHSPYFLGNTIGGFEIPFDGVATPEDVELAQREAISFAMYRLLNHRFQNAPSPEHQDQINALLNEVFINELGYDPENTSTEYVNGPAELGNYIAQQIIAFGLQDGSNEANGYANQHYQPINDSLVMNEPGNPLISDPNRWQKLSIPNAIDQAGNPIFASPPFLAPEWGEVQSFALQEEDLELHTRDGYDYHVYHNPGEPAFLDTDNPTGLESPYKWGFSLVSIWASHLDPTDDVMWDISPGGIGNLNIEDLPEDYSEYDAFYDLIEGGDGSPGYDENPVTGEPYEEQLVPRGDYARVLAEFWADGPDSETPPGHWYTILNYVNDHPELEKKWQGDGETLSDLEWDIKTYFTLGGAMHDVSVTSWGIKGWYDYIRPVSAIRYMCDMGQCTDEELDNYHPQGIPLVEDYIEVVEPGDPLAGDADEHVGKIKLFTWRGHEFIEDPEVDEAGVGWILGENWWPYQRPGFVTPPFAGFVSGHSTFSRAAAEVLTFMTGDEYFPGGLGEFEAPQNEFLHFEEGPSMDITLQWARYRDASDQCSLSRIWGGIHPPCDDIPGRKIGETVGIDAFNLAHEIFYGNAPKVNEVVLTTDSISDEDAGESFTISLIYNEMMDTDSLPNIIFPLDDPTLNSLTFVSEQWVNDSTFNIVYDVLDSFEDLSDIYLQAVGAINLEGNLQEPYADDHQFYLDTRNPMVENLTSNIDLITDANVGSEAFSITLSFSEEMDESSIPGFIFLGGSLSNSFEFNEEASSWTDEFTFEAVFDILDDGVEVEDATLQSIEARDLFGNEQVFFEEEEAVFTIDTKNPDVDFLSSNTYNIVQDNEGTASFSILAVFDEVMNTTEAPVIGFPEEDPTNTITLNPENSEWLNSFTYVAKYDVASTLENIQNIDVNISGVSDIPGNPENDITIVDYFSISMATSVGEIDGMDAVIAYPNPVPAGTELVVEMPENMVGQLGVSMYSSTGKMVYENQNLETSRGQLTLSTDGLAAGLYFIQVNSADEHKTLKVQVTR